MCSWLCCYAHLCAHLLQVKAEIEKLRSTAAAYGSKPLTGDHGGSPAAVPGAALEATGAALQRQVKEFAAGTQLDLQRQLKSWEARAVMAEEQLAQLQVGLPAINEAPCRDILR